MTRHEPRLDTRIRGRARHSIAAAAIAVLGLAGAVAEAPVAASAAIPAGAAVPAGSATPARAAASGAAAVPAAARSWSAFMYRSLTANSTIAQLRGTLAGQRVTLAARTAEIGKARAAETAAQAQVVAADAAGAAARDRHKAASKSLAGARQNLARLSKQRPRNAAAYTRAKNTVAAARKTVTARKTELRQAGTVLIAARARARAATAGVSSAIAACESMSATIRQTQQKIAAVGSAPELAGKAAALSRDVVTQVRTGFVVTDTITVYGVTVHKNVAYAFRRMLDDAKAQGIVLSGGGFRTKQRQIELRKINGCPDVWTAPASSCRVPTAIPGRSLHEIGLAVDVTSDGRTLTAKSPGFAWMAAHAAAYGFVNLPSEPWHWSITGS
jgi:D-alanyl-D-alanine carboxypeptidase